MHTHLLQGVWGGGKWTLNMYNTELEVRPKATNPTPMLSTSDRTLCMFLKYTIFQTLGSSKKNGMVN